jgi:hypothetical protein
MDLESPNTTLDNSGVLPLEDGLSDLMELNQNNHDAHWILLGKFQRLAESYRRLRFDYDEEKAAREKYEGLVRYEVCLCAAFL